MHSFPYITDYVTDRRKKFQRSGQKRHEPWSKERLHFFRSHAGFALFSLLPPVQKKNHEKYENGKQKLRLGMIEKSDR